MMWMLRDMRLTVSILSRYWLETILNQARLSFLVLSCMLDVCFSTLLPSPLPCCYIDSELPLTPSHSACSYDINRIDAAPIGGKRRLESPRDAIIPCHYSTFSIQRHPLTNVDHTSAHITCTLAACSLYRLTSVYVYDSSPAYVRYNEHLLRHVPSLAELLVLTDFGACPLVELACLLWFWNVR